MAHRVSQRRARSLSVLASLVAASFATQAQAQLNIWFGESDGFWDTVARWSLGAPVPGQNVQLGLADGPFVTVTHRVGSSLVNDLTAYNAFVMQGGTLDIAGQGSFHRGFLMQAGTIHANAARVSSPGAFTWTGGTLTGAWSVEGGTIGAAAGDLTGTLTNTGSLLVSGANVSGVVVNQGSLSLAGGSLADLRNTGTVTVTGTANAGNLVNQGTIGIAGSLEVSGGLSTGAISGGLLKVIGGTFGFGADSSTSSNVLASAATLNIESGATFTGSFLAQSGGRLVFDGGDSATFEELDLRPGAEVEGDGFRVTGTAFLSGGTITGAGDVDLANLELDGPVSYGGTKHFNVAFGFDWSAGDQTSLAGGAATFRLGQNLLGDISGSADRVWSAGAFTNAGFLTHSSSGVTRILSPFTNEQSVDITGGRLILGGPGGSFDVAHSGSFVLSGGAFEVAGGTHTFGGLVGSGQSPTNEIAEFSGGMSAFGAGSALNAGVARVTGGTVTFRSNASYSSNLLEVLGGVASFENGSLEDLGSVRLSGGQLQLWRTTRIEDGLWASGGLLGGDGQIDLGGPSVIDGSFGISGNRVLSLGAELDWRGGSVTAGPGFELTRADGGFLKVTGDDDRTWTGGTLQPGNLYHLGGGTTTIQARYLAGPGSSIQVSFGTLRLAGGGVLGGSISTGETGTFELGGGLFDVGGMLGGNTTIDGADVRVQSPGGIRGDVRVESGALRLLGGAQATDLNSLLVGDEGLLEVANGATTLPGAWALANYDSGQHALIGGQFAIRNGALLVPGMQLRVNRSNILLADGGWLASSLQGRALDEFRWNYGAFAVSNQALSIPGFDGSFSNASEGQISALNGGHLRFTAFANNDGGMISSGPGSVIEFTRDGSHSGEFRALTGGKFVFSGGAHDFEDGSVVLGDVDLTSGLMRFRAGSDFNDANINNDGGQVRFFGGTSANRGPLRLNRGVFDIDDATAFAGTVTLGLGATVNLNGGWMELRGGGSSRGILNVGPSHRLRFAGGAYDLLDSSRINGGIDVLGGQVNLQSGARIVGELGVFGGTFNYYSGGIIANTPVGVGPGGTLRVVTGRMDVPGGLANWSSATRQLTGGTYIVEAGSTLAFSSTGMLTNAGNIVLRGQGAKVGIVGARNDGDDALETVTSNEGAMEANTGADITFGGDLGNSGTLTVTSPGSTISVSGNMGNSGTFSTLNGGTSGVGFNLGNSGTLRVIGGTLNVGADLTNASGGEMNLGNNGTINVGGNFINQGSLTGDGNINSNLSNSGTLAPGASPGSLGFTGDIVLNAAGVLRIELAGTGDDQFDRLLAGGSATLGGKLEVTFLNGYRPRFGDRFAFLTATGGRLGTFDSVTFIGSGVPMELRYGTDRVELEAVPEPAALAALAAGFGAMLLRRRKRA